MFLSDVSMACFEDWLDDLKFPTREESKRPRKSALLVYRNVPTELDANLSLAERIVNRLKEELGPEKTDKLLYLLATRELKKRSKCSSLDACGSQPEDDSEDKDYRLLYGFWQRCIKAELNLNPMRAKKMQLKRALENYALRKYEGCQTQTALRNMRKGKSKRSSGGAQNSTKAIGLGSALLQFFVDVVRRLQCRADSCM